MSIIRNTRHILPARALVFLLVLAVFPSAGIGAGSDFEISPYVQNVDKTSATVFWKPTDEETGRVEYGPTATYGASSDGRIKYVVDNRPQPGKESVIRARLSDLVPNTIYHYHIMLSSSASEDRTFRTAPTGVEAAFTFLVYGDSRSNPEVHARVISAAVTTCDPAFVLATGDMVPSSGDGKSVWIKQFFKPADPLLRKTWFVTTRGNHEDTSRLFSLYFEGTGGSQDKDYYSFDWGPVHVITLDTNADYGPGSQQYEFLKRDLVGTSRPFKVFFGHHPTYSSSRHGGTITMQQYLQPLFERNGVKLVFAGHDHDYERIVVNGITYVVSGGGGAPLYGQEQFIPDPNSLVFKEANNFVLVDVTSGEMVLTAWAVDNNGVATIVDRAAIKQ
jgi:hypothetical protein